MLLPRFAAKLGKILLLPKLPGTTDFQTAKDKIDMCCYMQCFKFFLLWPIFKNT